MATVCFQTWSWILETGLEFTDKSVQIALKTLRRNHFACESY